MITGFNEATDIHPWKREIDGDRLGVTVLASMRPRTFVRGNRLAS